MESTVIEYHGVKCLNPFHKMEAERDLGLVVNDFYTMTARKSDHKVSLKCYWCGYEAEVDTTNKPLFVVSQTRQTYRL